MDQFILVTLVFKFIRIKICQQILVYTHTY